jgi:Holliday junction resolvase
MARTPEGAVKAKVRRMLDAASVYYFMPAGSAYGRAGIPDIVGCCDGKFFAIECKAGNNTTTSLQDIEIHKIKKAGGIALVINETNIMDVEFIWT